MYDIKKELKELRVSSAAVIPGTEIGAEIGIGTAIGTGTISGNVSEEICVLKQELDEHREVLNENTTEIQSNYEMLCMLDQKIEKIATKFEQVLLALQNGKNPFIKPQVKSFQVIPLTKKEKEVFLAFYSLCEELKNMVTYRQLARRLSLADSLVASYVSNFVAKGIPITKTYIQGVVYLSLDDVFRREQATKNLVGVNTLLSYWMR